MILVLSLRGWYDMLMSKLSIYVFEFPWFINRLIYKVTAIYENVHNISVLQALNAEHLLYIIALMYCNDPQAIRTILSNYS